MESLISKSTYSWRTCVTLSLCNLVPGVSQIHSGSLDVSLPNRLVFWTEFPKFSNLGFNIDYLLAYTHNFSQWGI